MSWGSIWTPAHSFTVGSCSLVSDWRTDEDTDTDTVCVNTDTDKDKDKDKDTEWVRMLRSANVALSVNLNMRKKKITLFRLGYLSAQRYHSPKRIHFNID